MCFTIELAGIPIEIRALYPAVREMCGSYLCDAPARVSVASDDALIAAEREHTGRDGAGSFQPDYLETLAVYRQIAEQIVEHDALLFHGSAIAVDGRAYLFTADSGTGKSTHARLWREVLPGLGHEVVMVNDDKPLLRFTGSEVLACGTPWDGKHHLSSNIRVPLRGICFLSRGETNRIARVDGKRALPELMKHSFRPAEAAHLLKSISLLDRLSGLVPLYALSCNMERQAAIISFEGMRARE